MRKIRHPHQVLEASEMVAGHRYAFVSAQRDGDHVRNFVFGGVIDDSHAAARLRGHDLNSCYDVKVFLDSTDKDIVTVHMDGWLALRGGRIMRGVQTLIYWSAGCFYAWDSLSTFLGSNEPPSRLDQRHFVVVPIDRWDDDPRIHVLDWVNPNDVVERAVGQVTESPAEWERVMRKRKHDAMARMLGFRD